MIFSSSDIGHNLTTQYINNEIDIKTFLTIYTIIFLGLVLSVAIFAYNNVSSSKDYTKSACIFMGIIFLINTFISLTTLPKYQHITSIINSASLIFPAIIGYLTSRFVWEFNHREEQKAQ